MPTTHTLSFSMSTANTFLLNCFVLGDDEKREFPVKIPRNDDCDIGILKDEIKKKKAHLLSEVNASDLDLWIMPQISTSGSLTVSSTTLLPRTRKLDPR